MNNMLYHHGILGMKWGIRRYQNKDGSLTAEGKRRYTMSKGEAKKFYKKNRFEMATKEHKYSDEYDNTEEGRNKKRTYEEALREMYHDDNWDDKKEVRFAKKEESYLRSKGEYAARKLIEEYGKEKASIYANRGRINTGKNAIKALSDEWWVHAV